MASPNMNNMQSMPLMPNAQNMSNMPNMPNMSNMPNMNNNGLYVPQSGGTSIAALIQNKKYGDKPSGNGMVNSARFARPNATPNPHGYEVDQNGYRIPVNANVMNNQPEYNRPNRMPQSPQPLDDSYSDTNSEYNKMLDLVNNVNDSLVALDGNEKQGRYRKRARVSCSICD